MLQEMVQKYNHEIPEFIFLKFVAQNDNSQFFKIVLQVEYIVRSVYVRIAGWVCFKLIFVVLLNSDWLKSYEDFKNACKQKSCFAIRSFLRTIPTQTGTKMRIFFAIQVHCTLSGTFFCRSAFSFWRVYQIILILYHEFQHIELYKIFVVRKLYVRTIS